jgi:hypothetical protein
MIFKNNIQQNSRKNVVFARRGATSLVSIAGNVDYFLPVSLDKGFR